MPDKEQKIVFVRMREFEQNMGSTLATDQEAGRKLMRTATTIEAASFDHWARTRFVVEAEKLGLDVCWVAEAWGSDGPSALGYYAACTERMLLGSGIIQVGTRTPVAVAQAAITLSNLSGGRFLLGLGASGPQVIEGLHGVSFARPLTQAAGNRRGRAPGGRRGQDLLLRVVSFRFHCPAGKRRRCGCRCARSTRSRSTWRRCPGDVAAHRRDR